MRGAVDQYHARGRTTSAVCVTWLTVSKNSQCPRTAPKPQAGVEISKAASDFRESVG